MSRQTDINYFFHIFLHKLCNKHLKLSLYDLYINYEDDIREKYQIPEYEVRRISRLQDV